MLLVALARAQDAVSVEPLPIVGDPAPTTVIAYALPRPDPAFLESEARFHVCEVRVDWGPTPAYEAPACTEAFGPAALAAARQWSFGEPARVRLRFLLRYEEAIGTLSTSAEIDPGRKEAFAGVIGAPGLRMVHPAEPRRPIRLKQKDLAPGSCRVRVAVDAAGRVREATSVDCAENAAVEAAKKAKFWPRVVDGVTQPDEVVVEVSAG